MMDIEQNEMTTTTATPPTVDTHLDAFVRDLTVFDGLSKDSVAIYRRMVQEFFTWLAGNDGLLPVDQITHQDVESYLEWCYYPVPGVRRGNSNQTRRTKLIALHRYARFLRRQCLVPVNSDFTKDIPKPKLRRKFVQKFTSEEHQAFFRAIDPNKEKGLRDTVIFILAGFGGLRAGEIWRLRLEHIQDDGKLIDIQVPEDIAKQGGRGSSGRTVDLWALPSRDIRRYVAIRYRQGARPEDPLLVTYRNKRPGPLPLNDSMLDSIVKFYAARAGINKTKNSLHMFRATHASDCRSVQGYDTPAIAQRLGHASIATTDRYLPDRRRIHKIYPSFAAYYRWYEKVWSGAPKEEIKKASDEYEAYIQNITKE